MNPAQIEFLCASVKRSSGWRLVSALRTAAHRPLIAVALTVVVGSGCTSKPKTPRAPVYPVAGVSPWWREGVCYEVFVRSFYDTDGDGIGDLNGLIARLNYINDGDPNSAKSLGANCIWLMPIARAMSYHGYDVTDYYHVDPRYGTDDDFRNLVTAAHKRGIHVIVDFVPNHSGSANPWFQAALRDSASPYRSWYRWSSTLPTQKGPWGQQAWHKSPLRDEYYYGVFWHEMPDLNYENPSVRAEMQTVLTYWLKEMHADGFRFDAIPYLVEDAGQLSHTRGTHDVLRQFGNAVRVAAPGSYTIGEMSDEDPRIMATYYPDQLDSYFAFGVAFATVDAARTGSAAGFIEAVSAANATFPAGRWSPFLTNHDHVRVMSQLGANSAKARVAASAMLMLPGMPFVYYGEEIGMIGTKPDETIRNPMQWSSSANGGFTNGKPWEQLQPDWRTRNVAAQDGDPASLLNHYRRLIRLRNMHPALNAGELSIVAGAQSGSVATWIRAAPGETIMIAVNFGERPAIAQTASLTPILSARIAGKAEVLYADPSNACGGALMLAETSMFLNSIAAHGFCAIRVSGR